jgi:hypothetical protein
MRNVISKVGKLAFSAFAVAVIGAGSAFAGDLTFQSRVQAEMNRGLDYSAAVAAASRASAPGSSPQLVRRAQMAQTALNAGKDYQDAWQAKTHSDSYTPDEIARARRIEDGLQQGKDYVQAIAEAQVSPRAVAAEGATARAEANTVTK